MSILKFAKGRKRLAILILLTANCLLPTYLFAQGDYWTQRASLPGANREYATAFSINGKGYLGLGMPGGTYLFDFWEYNPSTDSWTQKADFPDGICIGRRSASGFSIGDKGYIGPGVERDTTPPLSGDTMYTDFWEFNPSANLWLQKTSMPAPAGNRQYYVGFSINGKGYFGTGVTGGFSSSFFNDFWEYDPVLDTWTQKANFGGVAREAAVGFSLLGKGYIGTGDTASNCLNDFWEYDPGTNLWTQKANYPMQVGGAAAFAIDSIGKGYVGTGGPFSSPITDAFYEYDPVANTWTPRANFPPNGRVGAMGFSIGYKGYFSCGRSLTVPQDNNDLWEYTPPMPVSVNEITSLSINVYPNPSQGQFFIDGIEKGEVEIYNVAGQKVYKKDASASLSMTVDLSNQPQGVYFVRIVTEGGSYSQKVVKE